MRKLNWVALIKCHYTFWTQWIWHIHTFTHLHTQSYTFCNKHSQFCHSIARAFQLILNWISNRNSDCAEPHTAYYTLRSDYVIRTYFAFSTFKRYKCNLEALEWFSIDQLPTKPMRLTNTSSIHFVEMRVANFQSAWQTYSANY